MLHPVITYSETDPDPDPNAVRDERGRVRVWDDGDGRYGWAEFAAVVWDGAVVPDRRLIPVTVALSPESIAAIAAEPDDIAAHPSYHVHAGLYEFLAAVQAASTPESPEPVFTDVTDDEHCCHECGGEFFLTDEETSHHVGDGLDGIDYDADLDHVAFALDLDDA